LLSLFPCLVVVLVFLFFYLIAYLQYGGQPESPDLWTPAFLNTRMVMPWVLGGVLLWFIIAYFSHAAIIRKTTGSRPLQRKGNMRVYNLVENLCMSKGMQMPKINIIEDDSLNAFASGIDSSTYTVSLSRGIIRELSDEELETVIAHELAHIRHRDVRLLIVSIVFVGIFAMLTNLSIRILFRSGSRRSNKNAGAIILIFLMVVAIGYFFATLMRFAISRKREYLADAAAAEMTRRPEALVGALRKISSDPDIEAVTRDDVAQLFIEHPRKKAALFSGFRSLFATHPPIEKRIAVLEQF
jgi:heat shock protein HtpX